MASADVARLRFVMSADAGGLKAGCKDAVGSLKDMSSQAGQAMNRLDTGGIDWKGLKKSARSLKFVGREMGGIIKGGIGDVIGIASAGAGMGPMGVGLAAGAVGANLYQQHQEQLEKDRTQAFHDLRASSQLGLKPESYSMVSRIAGDDAKFLDDMAGAMKKLQDQGPGASESLKQLGRDIEALDLGKGIGGKTGAEMTETRKMQAMEKELANQGAPRNTFWEGVKGTEDKSLKAMQEKLHLSDAEMNKFSESDMFANRHLKGGSLREGEGFDVYRKHMADFWDQTQDQEKSVRLRAEMENDPSLKTNKENLEARLSRISEAKKAGASDELVGRATKEALGDYSKSEGGPAGMAGASASGSVEAYSVVANAQMAAQSGAESTNVILEKHFPELIKAVERITPNWRKVDSPP